MVFLRPSQTLETGPVLKTPHLTLRLPQMGDFVAWSELRARSRELLVPYVPKWAENELSRDAFRNRLRFYRREFRDTTGYPFFIFLGEAQSLIGGVTISNVRRGVTQSACLGYWLGVPFINKGYMSEAVKRVQGFVFKDLRLHRLEAASMPENKASIRVLEKCGFHKEGLARRYLCINGQWRDHFLFSVLDEEFHVVETSKT